MQESELRHSLGGRNPVISNSSSLSGLPDEPGEPSGSHNLTSPVNPVLTDIYMPEKCDRGDHRKRTITEKEKTMINHRPEQCFVFLLGVLLMACLLTTKCQASSEIELLKGQTVYVPVYSHIYIGDRERPFDLTVTLSIRNTDPNHPITIVSVDYICSNGELLRNYLKNPIKLNAMASTRYVVEESNKSGGSGANFIVRWKSDNNVNEPIIEGIMIGTKAQQGISFLSRGRAIKEQTE